MMNENASAYSCSTTAVTRTFASLNLAIVNSEVAKGNT